MSATAKDIYKRIGALEDAARKQLAVCTELRAYLASVNLPEPQRHQCPRCTVQVKSKAALEEHLHVSHDVELPA